MPKLEVKNFRQQTTVVFPNGGQAQTVVRVNYDVYNGQQLVASHVKDYQPTQFSNSQVKADISEYVAGLADVLNYSANLGA